MEMTLFEKGQKRGGASRPIEGGKLFSPTFYVGLWPANSSLTDY